MGKKVYVLMISRVFPAYHPRAGKETNFVSKILAISGKKEVPFDINGNIFLLDRQAYYSEFCFEQGWTTKRHTIRLNYDLWARRAEKINRGEAVLSLRQWSGKPYASKQQEFLQLEKIGVQRIELRMLENGDGPTLLQIRLPEVKKYGSIPMQRNISVPEPHIEFARTICKNDGLNDYDFKRWFKKDFSGCVIHFTDFKY